MSNTPITVAHGDGIGPEIMDAVLQILDAAGATLDINTIEIGEKVYLSGVSSGISQASWDSLRQTKVFLKAPITTPQGGGFKSLNVTVRKTLGLYANVRPCVAYHPFVTTKHPQMDVVIVRENEEDLYAGIEHQQTNQVTQCLKLISVPGCEKIIRYAFEYAKQNNRQKVTCFTKDNIMKLTDGLFHKVFDAISKDYPDIENEHWIVDIGAAKLADTPENFDIIVTPNLYGDILSDVAAQIAGSVGLAGSANIGEHGAMFEAIHGSAPRRAGQNLANPSGLLMGAILMLVHIGQAKVAETVHNAWLSTIEAGIHTYDIYSEAHSQQKVGTKEFGAAVISRLGQTPETLAKVSYSTANQQMDLSPRPTVIPEATRELVGVDVFLYWQRDNIEHFAAKLKAAAENLVELSVITNRGVKIWPEGLPETFCSDHWRCRFKSAVPITQTTITQLLQNIDKQGIEFIKIENLYNFDGQPGYSLAQGE